MYFNHKIAIKSTKIWRGDGGHIGDIKHSFTSAGSKASIADFRFHDLRHTYTSHLAMRGVHIRALQELLGHKTLAMTQRYSHLGRGDVVPVIPNRIECFSPFPVPLRTE